MSNFMSHAIIHYLSVDSATFIDLLEYSLNF